jgi:hypothetical protein
MIIEIKFGKAATGYAVQVCDATMLTKVLKPGA